jgi:ATP dependent DNA ligase C terminal region
MPIRSLGPLAKHRNYLVSSGYEKQTFASSFDTWNALCSVVNNFFPVLAIGRLFERTEVNRRYLYWSRGIGCQTSELGLRERLRSGSWVKVKLTRVQEFVIGGYTLPEGSRKYFGSLLVGYHGPDGLLFAGRVGTGFSEKVLANIGAQLQKLRRTTCPFTNLPEKTRGRWTDLCPLPHPRTAPGRRLRQQRRRRGLAF